MEPENRTHTTTLLHALSGGESAAAEQLLPFVYDELRHIAGRLMGGQARGHTLQPTELIHEAYIRLIGADDANSWEDRNHFTRVAARAMRFVLVDHARAKLSHKRGGQRHRVTLDAELFVMADNAEALLFVHDGLEELARVDEQLAQIVEMRFFAGMTMDEIAGALGSSTRTVERGWRLARAWWIRQFGTEEHREHD